MKILTIRGRNLTSLAGDFALELDQPPLDKLGLFAITGATGAGKSTLLDAMCLALFDCTPRLEQGGGVLVGRSGEDEKARLKDNDARGVLRRGALEGLAEVEFLGKDGRRYKANWSVRRAHNRQDGRIMEPVMSLADVASGQLFGAKKGEVLKAIEEKLGLSFEQFRRSALLAQGEFAAFLRAKEKERAELLERMTGTEVYSRLSIAAHKRNKQVEAELEKQAQGLEAVKLLSEEERQQEAGALVREQSELTQAREVQARAEDAVRWYQTRASHLAREREADTERERAEQALLAAAPRRLDWERVSAAEALRAPMSAVDEATAALAARDTEWAARRAEEAAARETERAGEAERGEAERRRDAAVAAEEAARPELDAAEALDGELKHLEELAREAAREHEKARDGEQRARTALAVLLEKEGAARKRVEDIQAWRDKRGPVEPVAREWSRWETELKRYQQQARQEAESQGLLERTRARTEPLHGEVLRLDETRRQATEAMRLAEAETVRLASERGVEADAERRLRREALSTRHELLKELEATRQEVVDTARAEREASREVEEARSEQTQATAEAEAARVRRIGLDASLKEARRAFEQARDAQGLTALRAELREGEPCPLCGATEHPHARAELALEKLVEEGRGRVTSLEAELEQVARGESAATVRAQGAGQRAVQAGERAEAATKRMATRSERWLRSREALVGTRPPEAVESPEAETWLAEALTQTRTQAELLRAEEARAEARAREVEAARVRKEAARTDAEAAEQAWRGVDEAWRKNVEAASQCQRDVEQARGVREELLTALSVAFKEWKNWEPALAKDVPAFQERCAKAVREWNEQEGALRQAEADARSEADQRGPAQATAELLQAQTGVCARTVAERNEALVRARAARGQLWAGRATVEVRAALRREREESARSFEARREQAEKTARGAAVALSRSESAASARALASTAWERAGAALAVRLTEHGLSLEQLRALLSRGAPWLVDEKRALDALQRAHDNAVLLAGERQRQRLQHESSARPVLAEDEAASARERALADTEARMRGVSDRESRLARDDQARREHGERARLLEEAQRQSGVWRTLSDLIGSHDGKQFKVFAQSLTLDALLHHANAHLEELAPRYRLMRAPGSDLDLQVEDRDMGDEVRAVSSLSGGESFLVSLALALGLASLSSETTQVETLFIDEGFGTLDPETLEVALATLDALQATGRQVGIISHVPGLAERIGVQVRVVKQGAGRSRLLVVGGSGPFGGLPSRSRPPATVGQARSR